GWFNWNDVRRHRDVYDFVRGLIRFRSAMILFRWERFWGHANDAPRLTWHGVRRQQPDWSFGSRSLAYEVCLADGKERLLVLRNVYGETLTFELPGGVHWRRVLDTALPAPQDIAPPGEEVAIGRGEYLVTARSVVVLRAD